MPFRDLIENLQLPLQPKAEEKLEVLNSSIFEIKEQLESSSRSLQDIKRETQDFRDVF